MLPGEGEIMSGKIQTQQFPALLLYCDTQAGVIEKHHNKGQARVAFVQAASKKGYTLDTNKTFVSGDGRAAVIMP